LQIKKKSILLFSNPLKDKLRAVGSWICGFIFKQLNKLNLEEYLPILILQEKSLFPIHPQLLLIKEERNLYEKYKEVSFS